MSYESPDVTKRPDFDGFMKHGMKLTTDEIMHIDKLSGELPDIIHDVHVHTAEPASFDFNRLTSAGRHSMVSTYPVTTIEDSQKMDELFWKKKKIRKLRFAHATNGHDQAKTNEYLKHKSPQEDKIAFFGQSERPEQVDATIAGLASGAFRGLKMYYAASRKHRYGHVYDYFPKHILAAAERAETPIILHLPNGLTQSAHEVHEVCEDFPRLRIVLAHIGVSFAYSPQVEKSLVSIADLSQVSVDTSGVTDVEVLTSAVQHLGAKRVLFGTDEPFGLMRDVTYVHPELGPRLLTDIPYHWTIPEERAEFLHLRNPKVPNNHIQQLQALVAVAKTLPDADRDAIFTNNASDHFGLGI